MKRSLRFVRSQYATSWWQAVLIWLAMCGSSEMKPKLAVGDVYGKGKGGDPFNVVKARVLEIRDGWVKYRLEFPESERPGLVCHTKIAEFLMLYPVKEN